MSIFSSCDGAPVVRRHDIKRQIDLIGRSQNHSVRFRPSRARPDRNLRIAERAIHRQRPSPGNDLHGASPSNERKISFPLMAFMRIRSPRSAPPLRRRVGSTNRSATRSFGASRRKRITSSSTTLDLPAPPRAGESDDRCGISGSQTDGRTQVGGHFFVALSMIPRKS